MASREARSATVMGVRDNDGVGDGDGGRGRCDGATGSRTATGVGEAAAPS
jgi:hypothetical protein